jgi:hypothetical protein
LYATFSHRLAAASTLSLSGLASALAFSRFARRSTFAFPLFRFAAAAAAFALSKLAMLSDQLSRLTTSLDFVGKVARGIFRK